MNTRPSAYGSAAALDADFGRALTGAVRLGSQSGGKARAHWIALQEAVEDLVVELLAEKADGDVVALGDQRRELQSRADPSGRRASRCRGTDRWQLFSEQILADERLGGLRGLIGDRQILEQLESAGVDTGRHGEEVVGAASHPRGR